MQKRCNYLQERLAVFQVKAAARKFHYEVAVTGIRTWKKWLDAHTAFALEQVAPKVRAACLKW